MQPELIIDWGLEVWQGLPVDPDWWEYEDEDDNDHVYVYTRLCPLVIRRP